MDVPALLPRLVRELGAETIVLTAAVGGVEPGLAGGTVAVITDHVNLMGTAPLRGWRYPDGMPAFIPMGQAYDPSLADLALARARALGIAVAPGVYAAMSGPAYETPPRSGWSDRRARRSWGCRWCPRCSPRGRSGCGCWVWPW